MVNKIKQTILLMQKNISRPNLSLP